MNNEDDPRAPARGNTGSKIVEKNMLKSLREKYNNRIFVLALYSELLHTRVSKQSYKK